MPVRRAIRVAKLAWAAPCSLVGLVLGAAVLLGRGSATRSAGVLEFTWRESLARCGPRAARLPYRAIAFGHVIVAITREELEVIGPHERVHVAQYERWGIFFFPAYAASSLWQLLRGRDAYWDNRFEVEARSLAAESTGATVDCRAHPRREAP